MRNFLVQSLCLVAAAAHLIAADPVWKSKPADQWTEEDARQVLANSPWARQISAVITRRLTEDQLREAGQMGQPRTVGNVGVDPKGSGPKVSPNVFSGPGGDDRSPRSLSPVHHLETALGERSPDSARGVEIARGRTSHVAG